MLLCPSSHPNAFQNSTLCLKMSRKGQALKVKEILFRFFDCVILTKITDTELDWLCHLFYCVNLLASSFHQSLKHMSACLSSNSIGTIGLLGWGRAGEEEPSKPPPKK